MKQGLCILILALFAGVAGACKVPVFRYALERWEPGSYRAVFLYRGGTHQEMAESLALQVEQSQANVTVELLDADALTEAQKWQIDGLEDIGDDPLLRLYYPFEAKIDAPFWEGPLNAASVERALDSPLRQKIVETILEGSSTTWVLLETGDSARDTEAAARLQRLLEDVSKTLSIPEGVVRAEDVGAQGKSPEGVPLEMDDVLRTSIPLMIHFPVVRLAPDDAQEEIFRAMLSHLGRRSFPMTEPVAVPVFGRGRALEGIPASMINATTIRGAAEYLCGECSCQVKDQNPGVDLCLAADWAEKLSGSFVLVERPHPDLSGFGVDLPATSAGADHPRARRAMGRPLPRAIVYSMGGLLAAVLIGTYLIMRRRSG